jgi:hypothetical protein
MMAMHVKTILIISVVLALALIGAPVYAGQPAHADAAATKAPAMAVHDKPMAPNQPTFEGDSHKCPCTRNIARQHEIRGTQAFVEYDAYQKRPAAEKNVTTVKIDREKKIDPDYIR